MRTAARACAAVLLVLAVLPQAGGFLPRDGPASGHPTPPFLAPAAAAPDATPGARALIVEVYYRAVRDDEYIGVGNPRDVPLDLSGWTLTDLEGSASFPAGTALPAYGRVVAARNSTSYAEDTRLRADFTYDRGDAPKMAVMRVPLLANDGDEVLLRDPTGAVVDALTWGGSAYDREGWSGPPAAVVRLGHRAVRASLGDRWADTDSAADWDSIRPFPLGQVDWPLETFAAAEAEAFLSPDDALPVLSALLHAARQSAYVAVYTLTSEDLAAELAVAARRGVDLRILLEGSPVGGIDAREWSIAQNLSAAGAQVRFLAGELDADVVPRYRFLHAKYAVLDQETAIVGSENWGVHGFPPPPRSGNRGWHLAVRDPALARYLAAAFLDDFDPQRRDSVGLADFRPRTVPSAAMPLLGTRAFAIPSRTFAGPLTVTPILGPDHTLRADAVLGALRSAVRSIDVEVLTAEARWGDLPNPYLEALVAAVRRGVRVRVLLAGSDFGTAGGDPLGNRATADFLNGIAKGESLPLEVRLLPTGAGGLAKVHAKGFLVDGRTVFVSSLNWNRNSATRNREIGLLVESAAVAAFFGAAFEADWSAADGGAIPLRDLAAPVALIVAPAALVAWFLRRRRRAKEL